MVGRMVGRRTAEKKRCKNFVLGSPKKYPQRIAQIFLIFFADAKFLRDLDKFLATNLKPDIFTVLVKTTRLIETSVTRLLLGAFWLLKMNINWVGLKSSNYGITGHQTCKKATELAQDYCSFHNMLMIPL